MPANPRNLKLEIGYDGTNYCGWQIQRHKPGGSGLASDSQSHKDRSTERRPSIQETIEKALRKILQEKVKLTASGRTDAGVHALAQVANFKTNSKIRTDKLQAALNSLLPDDIAINKIEQAGRGFHSRFSARSKIYRYLIVTSRDHSVFLKNKAHFCSYPLNIKLMRQEAGFLPGRHDFRGFCARAGIVKTTTRTVKKISIGIRSYGLWTMRYPLIVLDIEADGFLYNMARGIAGTLIDIGRGRLKKGHIQKMLRTADRALCGATAPAKGLYLLKVKY